jgi:hydroxymethylpyrimidine pyrophosphatase-like HAD family hydrolase
MIIAIDFDGTCVTHEYPKVGREIGASKVLKELVDSGHQLILFTMRSDGHSYIVKNIQIALLLIGQLFIKC